MASQSTRRRFQVGLAVTAVAAGAVSALPALTGWGAPTAAARLSSSSATPPYLEHAVGVDDAEPDKAARSTIVKLVNQTGCSLKFAYNTLWGGMWSADDTSPKVAAKSIGKGKTVAWASQSDRFMTGTEGKAGWTTHHCSRAGLNNKRVEFYWNNPYIGANYYDWNGTDPALQGTQTEGKGNNATVKAEIRAK